MSMQDQIKAQKPSSAVIPHRILQRKSSKTGEEPEHRRFRQQVPDVLENERAITHVPPIVNEVLHSPG
jgi:hypothetical protein